MPPTRQSQLLLSPFPPSSISHPLFSRLLFFAQIPTHHPPKSPALENLCYSPVVLPLRCISNAEREREIILLFVKISGRSLSFSHRIRRSLFINIYKAFDSTRQISKYRRFIVGGLNNRIDKSDDRLDDQSRRGNSRATTSPPACTVQRHESTLKLRQYPS